jgi:hypothetical protein
MQPQLEGGVYRLAIASDPRDDVADCYKSLDKKLEEAADDYVARLTNHPQVRVRLPLPYVLEHVKRDQWQEARAFEFAGEAKTMYVVHALLEFDDQDRAHLRALETDALRRQRLWQTGLGAGLLLAVLGTAFGYLKLDTLTKGYYSGRLKLAAAAVVAAVAAAGWWLAAGPVNLLP